MLNIIAANPLPYIIAILIGLATAWWIWGGRTNEEADLEDADENQADITEAATTEAEAAPDRGETGADAFTRTADRDRHPPEYRPAEGHAAAAASIAAAAATIPSIASDQADDGKSSRKGKAAIPAETPLSIAPAIGAPDDLKRIKGVGPKLETLLNSLGVKRFDQIAAWSGADIAEVDEHLATFRGRIVRDDWLAQAALLANGKVTEHRNQYGG